MSTPRILYLHGLASSPQSTKARFFGERLRSLGHEVICPDLNEGDFTGLTTTRALTLATRLALGLTPPIVIFGSSFGGRVAARTAEAMPDRVAGLLLMAPAFYFQHVWDMTLNQEVLRRWRDTGALAVDHPAFGREVGLGYGFYTDGLRTDGYPALPPSLPALVFHGASDAVVPIADSARFAETHAGARLVVLGSDHELNDRLEEMWCEVEPFIGEVLD